MKAFATLPSLLSNPRRLRTVASDIYSILPPDVGPHLYDKRAALYDVVVGKRLYNRIAWGNSPKDYSDFARRAVADARDSWLLDAGAGSLLFTADPYLECGSRPILVLDQSLAMLARARRRLIDRAGEVPGHIVLLQGDLADLAGFVPSSIGTILCLHVLHHLDAADALISNFTALLTSNGGCMYITSLIASGRVSDLYLKALYATGGFARPRTEHEIRVLFERSKARDLTIRVQGNILYAISSSSVELAHAPKPPHDRHVVQ
jgi:SAM-dependent methyltransferase